MMSLQISGRRRQHGADDEGGGDRKEEGLGEVEHRDDGNDQQCHQRESHHLGAADDRRQIGFAVWQRCAGGGIGKRTFSGKDTQLALPYRR
jgi:hypothetical protein